MSPDEEIPGEMEGCAGLLVVIIICAGVLIVLFASFVNALFG